MLTQLITPILPVADVLFAFRESNIAGQLIVIFLFVGSIIAWSIMVTKYVELSRAKRSSQLFLSSFRGEKDPLELYLKQQRYPESPLYPVYESACEVLGTELGNEEEEVPDSSAFALAESAYKLNGKQNELIRAVAERHMTDQALQVEKNMGFLASAVSASPFLGLLGTVWGVMEAFGGMAVTGAATLSAVAPGIAGALLTTVIGLLVALPSSIGYNILTSQIRELHVLLENYTQEFLAEVQRVYLEA